MFNTLSKRLLAVLVCFAVGMAFLFLVVMRHLDTSRNQELHQKLYRTLASQLVSDSVAARIRSSYVLGGSVRIVA